MIAEPVMMSKATSANRGRLELNIENNNLIYTKFKEQAMGRIDIITWLIIKLTRIIKKDKVLFEIYINDIKSIDFSPGNGPYQYGNFKIETIGEKYNIQFEEESKDTIEEIYNYLKENIK